MILRYRSPDCLMKPGASVARRERLNVVKVMKGSRPIPRLALYHQAKEK